MGVNGITVMFNDPAKRKRRLEMYREYIVQLTASKKNNQLDESVAEAELAEDQKGYVE